MRWRLQIVVAVLVLLFAGAAVGAHAADGPADAAPAGKTPDTAPASPDDDAGGREVKTDPGAPDDAEASDDGDEKEKACGTGESVLDTVVGGDCNKLDDAADAVTGIPGKAVESVAGSVFDKLTEWVTDAATAVTKKITGAIEKTTTPELKASWYREQFGSMVGLGLGLSALVAMLSLTSAAVRRDPDALGSTFLGIWRAGLGTGIVLGLTVLALGVADSITNYVATSGVGKDANNFWGDVATAWGDDGAKAFGSTMLTFVFAFVAIIAAVAVWLEMLVRSAAIYVAVLFMPAALAAGIWPAMRQWQSRLTKALFVFIAMKPVIVTVLSLAGTAAAAGLGGAKGPVGILLASVVIFALAAWSPWALMQLVSMDAEGTHVGGSVRGGAGAAAGAGAGKIGGALGSASSGAGKAKKQLSGRMGGGGASGGGAGASGAKGGGSAGAASRGSGSPTGAAKPAGAAGAAGPKAAGAGAGSAGGGAAAAGAGAAGAGVGAVAAAAGMTHQAGKSVGGAAGSRATAATSAGSPASEGASGAGGASRAPGGSVGGGASGAGSTGAGAGGRGAAPGSAGGESPSGGRTVAPSSPVQAGGSSQSGGRQSGGAPVPPSSNVGQRPGGGRRA